MEIESISMIACALWPGEDLVLALSFFLDCLQFQLETPTRREESKANALRRGRLPLSISLFRPHHGAQWNQAHAPERGVAEKRARKDLKTATRGSVTVSMISTSSSERASSVGFLPLFSAVDALAFFSSPSAFLSSSSSSFSSLSRSSSFLPSLFHPPPPPTPTPTPSRHLSQLLKEHCLIEGGDLQVAAFIKDEGYDASLPALLSAVDEARSSDLLFWAGRYNLFVLWSADRQHPWDALPNAGRHVSLEVGALRDSGANATPVVLLEGRPIGDYTFAHGVLKTTAPIQWDTPDGGRALVNLEVQFSSFFGYGKAAATSTIAATETPAAEGNAYLGLQCHGILWPAPGAESPALWPIAPPLVSGKVNIAGRAAAVSPGCADSLAAFVGSYATHVLPTEPGAPAAAGSEISIAVSSQGRPIVTVGAAPVSAWSFDANNVLSWEGEAGCSAWLQFMVLPGEFDFF